MSPPRKPRIVGAVAVGVVLLAIAILAPLALLKREDEPTGTLFDFKVGTEWTYEKATSDARSRVVVRVVGNEGGRVTTEHRTYEKDASEPALVTTWVHYVENGFLMQAGVNGGKMRTPFRLYKLGSRKGQTWKRLPDDKDGELMKNLGLADMRLPAGRFPRAVSLRWDRATAVEDTALVPGVGLVQQEYVVKAQAGSPGGRLYVLRLAEFKPAP